MIKNLNDMQNNKPVFDIIGVGIGPFNLSMASLLSGIDNTSSLFFDDHDEFNWHPGLLMEDCTLQVPLMADLVTMADPTNPYSYLNYLHETGRLYHFYFYEEFLIPRVDYNLYCQWVCTQLDNLHFGQRVIDINEHPMGFEVRVLDKKTHEHHTYLAKHVVLGTGSTPNIPETAGHVGASTQIYHSSQYLANKASLQQSSTITVVGSGQSAAEIFLDLLNDQAQCNYALNWLTRSDGFLPMEYSKLGLEHFSPDYIDHFHQLTESRRDAIRQGQDLWYKGISEATIADIYDRLYKRSLGAKPLSVTLQARSELTQVDHNNGQLLLHFRHLDLDEAFSVTSEQLILATGYQHTIPACLSTLLPHFETDSQGRLTINRDYEVVSTSPLKGRLFVQNAELHSHGIAAPDLGLGAYRSAMIINTILGQSIYNIRQSNVFQAFGIAKKWQQKPEQPATPKQQHAISA